MKKILLLISCFFLVLQTSQSVFAEGWRKAASYSREALYGIYFTSESVGYCVGGDNTSPYVAVIYKTTDGGVNWKEVYREDNIKQLNKVQFINDKIGFAAGAGANLLKTTDAGLSWTKIPVTGTTTDLTGIYFSDEQTGSILSNSGVLRTTDGGKNWTSTLALTNATTYDMNFWSPTHGAIIGKSVGDTYYTKDGITWTKAAPAPLTGAYTKSDLHSIYGVNDSSIYAAGWGSLATGQPTIIVKSTDGGATWTQYVASDNNKTWDYLYGVSFKDKDNGIAIGGSSRATLAVKTTDGGATWNQINVPIGGSARCMFSLGNSVWIGTDDGIIASSKDFGNSWTLQPGIPSINVNSIQYPAGKVVYAAGDDGAFLKSTDNGKTWTTKYIRVNNISPNIQSIYFVNENLGFAAHSYRRVCKTTDGGETWKEILPDTNNVGVYSYGLYFFNELNGVVVGKTATKVDVIYRTTDGGTTWDVKNNIFKANLKAVAFGSESNGVIVGEGLKACFTTDGGKTWTASTFNGVPSTKATANLTKVTFLDQKTAVAVGTAIVVKTTDGGATWNYVDIPGSVENLAGVAFKDALHGWATGSKNTSPKWSCVYQTSDGGNTWTNVADTTVMDYNAFIIDVACDANDNLWVTGLNGEIYTNSKVSAVAKETKALPASFELSQNYPNPFNPSTIIEYSLPKMSNVVLNVYDALGKCVKTLVNEKQNAGNYSVDFNASDLSSGLYFYSLKVDGRIVTKKMSLIK